MLKYAIPALLAISLTGCGGGSGGSAQNAATNSSTTASNTSAGSTSSTSTYFSGTVTVNFSNPSQSGGVSSVANFGSSTSTVATVTENAMVLQVGPDVASVTLAATRTPGQVYVIELSAPANQQKTFTSIINLSAGDTVKTSTPITDATWLAEGKTASASFDANEVVVPDPSTSTLMDYANYAVRTVAIHSGDAAWFTYNGDTYLVENVFGQEYNFTNGTDVLVKLAGTVNLANATIVNGAVVLQ